MDSQTLARIVREANRSEIARKTGIDLSHVSRVLSGKRTPSSDNLAAISRELGCSMDELYTHLSSLRKRVRRSASNAAA